MKIRPVGATLGALVEDVRLASISSSEFRDIEDAWHEFGVLVFRDQHLSDEDHVAFSKRFGRLELGLKRASSPSVSSALARMTNITRDGGVVEPTSLQWRFHVGNTHWHSDSSYKRVGAKASLLAAHVVPEEGGETEWADMRAAWDALDTGMKDWLEDKVAVHSYVYSHSWHGGLEVISDEDVRHLPPVEHAVVKVHPDTGRKSLFVGRHASHIVGQDEAESRALLKTLTSDACQPPRLWKYRWQPGDLGMWDNRCVLHRGHLWPQHQKRSMVRTTVAGDGDNEWALAEAS